MAATLGFHIIPACLGSALPAVMLIAGFTGLHRPGGDDLGPALAAGVSVRVPAGAVTGNPATLNAAGSGRAR
jgi:hypothetical protein